MCSLSKLASFSFVFSNRLRQRFVIPHKAQEPPFPNTTTGKSNEPSDTGPPLEPWQTALTSLLPRKVVHARKGRGTEVKPSARLLCACWWHPHPQTQPSTCREPLRPAVFTGASSSSSHCTAPRPGHQQLQENLFPSSPSATPHALCSQAEPSITHLLLTRLTRCTYCCSQCPSNMFGEAIGLLS